MPERRKYNKIPDDIREKIIQSVMYEARSLGETGQRFGYPKATIASIVEKWKRTGNAHRSHASNRPRLMTEEMDAFVREKYDDNPALTIATVTDMMNDHFHTHITERTVEAHLNRSGNDQYRMKLMRNEPADFNNPTKICDRREWCEEFMRQHFSLDDCIHLDEAGFNLKLHRKQGRARRGRHPINVHNQRGPNHTLLVAVSRTQGVFARRLRMNLTTNGNAFEAFLTEEVLPNIDEPNKLIVLDNAPIHRTRRIKDLIQNAGHRVKMLPSYTPFFNCTEWVFGSVKPFICCNELRISNETLPQLIDDGLDRITTDMVEGWMREVMRYFLLALREEPLGRMYDNRSYMDLAQFQHNVENEEEEEEEEDGGAADGPADGGEE